ncbi:MAG: phosphopantetheine-binding protein [Candidatus Sumerlaeota bacterium]|nr:phosphopantetheine-binding protein [Candidatus Sumerlaeota bacterium]
MDQPTKEQVFNDLVKIIRDLAEDWEFSGEITPDTTMLGDLSFESIDAVALASAIEELYGQSFPFAEYFSQLEERKIEDLRVQDVVDFIHGHLQPAETKG